MWARGTVRGAKRARQHFLEEEEKEGPNKPAAGRTETSLLTVGGLAWLETRAAKRRTRTIEEEEEWCRNNGKKRKAEEEEDLVVGSPMSALSLIAVTVSPTATIGIFHKACRFLIKAYGTLDIPDPYCF